MTFNARLNLEYTLNENITFYFEDKIFGVHGESENGFLDANAWNSLANRSSGRGLHGQAFEQLQRARALAAEAGRHDTVAKTLSNMVIVECLF